MTRALPLFLACVTGAVASDGTGLSAADLKRAEKLNKQKRYRCHKAYDPREYSTKAWDEWMSKMFRKARLKPKPEELLARYFNQVRSETQNAPE